MSKRDDNPIPDKRTLLRHAEGLRESAQEILQAPPQWVQGDPGERSKEYIELAQYFEALAAGARS